MRAFVLYDPENRDDEKFYNEVFEPKLASMGWKCTTASQLQSGVPWLECFQHVIEHCLMHFIFPMPNLQSKNLDHMRQLLITFSLSNNDKSVLMPITFTHSNYVHQYCNHLTVLKLDTTNPDGNTVAWEHIQDWIDDFGEHQNVEIVGQTADGDVFQSSQEWRQSQPVAIGESSTINTICSSGGSETVRQRTALKSNIRKPVPDVTNDVDKSVHLLVFHLKWTTWLTSNQFLCIWLVVVFISFFLEIDKTMSTLSSSPEQQQQLTLILKGMFPVFLKIIAGIASMWCLRRSVYRLNSLKLSDSLSSDDIVHVREYMIKRGLLKKKSHLDDKDVLHALKGYLSSSDIHFLVLPLLHIAVMGAMLFTQGLFSIPWYDQSSASLSICTLCVLIDAVTIIGTIVFCQIAVSMYHLQYRILIDIYEQAAHSTPAETAGSRISPSACGPGMQNSWEKLGTEVGTASKICLQILTVASVVQIYMIFYCLYNYQWRTVMDIIAIALLLFTEALSSCPSRWMKLTGLVCSTISFLALARHSVTAIPYGNIYLILFRLLSIKLTFVLVLHYRLMVVTKDCPFPCHFVKHIRRKRLLFVVAVFLIGSLVELVFAT